MSFKDGFDAIDKVKASSQRLGDAVARIEALETHLAELREAHASVEAMLDKARTAFATLEEAANGLSNHGVNLGQLAAALPTVTEKVLAAAESRLQHQQAEIVRLVQGLPAMLETVVEQKLTAIVAQLEARQSERLRDELKDTRTTLREAFEINATRTEARLEDVRKEIIAEMPRTLFGRRGR